MVNCAKSAVLSALIGLILLIANTSASSDDRKEVPDLREFRVALSKAYPGYSEYQWPASMRGYRQSPANFIDDVLFGDFNFDGVIDYSAKLTRPITDDELADLPARHHDTIKVVGVVVVCDGLDSGDASGSFRCSQLTQERLGGSDGWLDLIDLTVWLDDLENESEEYGNSDCPNKLRTPAGQKLLSLVEPIGHCDAFYYPIDSGGYGRCFYCAD